MRYVSVGVMVGLILLVFGYFNCAHCLSCRCGLLRLCPSLCCRARRASALKEEPDLEKGVPEIVLPVAPCEVCAARMKMRAAGETPWPQMADEAAFEDAQNRKPS